MKNIFKRATALMLSLLMVFSVCSTSLVIYAQDAAQEKFLDELWASLLKDVESAEKKPLVYVSIGDSMTNGYGLEGYDGESGIVNYAVDSYANKFAAWLAGYEGEIVDDQVIFDGDNGIVDHRQLAMSGMRAEDMRWLLELDYTNEELMKACFYTRNPGRTDWGNEAHDWWFGYDDNFKASGLAPIGQYNGSNFVYPYASGFTAGDYRTMDDLCKASYRVAQGAAKLLVTYHHDKKLDGSDNDAKGYFTSSYTTNDPTVPNKFVDLAYTGIGPDNATHTSGQGSVGSSGNHTDVGKYYPGDYSARVLGVLGYHMYLQIAGEFYQESIKDADVITLALGNTNFGTWMFDEMKSCISNGSSGFDNNYKYADIMRFATFDSDLQAKVLELADKMDPLIDKYFDSESVGSQTCADDLKYIIKYCILSYLINYIGCLEEILILNEKDDLAIIQVPLMNAYASDNKEDFEGGTNFASLIDIIYEPVNAFLAALPTYMQATGNELYEKANFYYADLTMVDTLSVEFGDDFYTDGGKAIEYPGLDLSNVSDLGFNDSVVRDRFIKWICGTDRIGTYVKDNCSCEYGEIWKGLLGPYNIQHGKFFGIYDLMFISETDIQNYEKLSADGKRESLTSTTATTRDKAFSCAMYLAFENAIIESGRGAITIEALKKLGGMSYETFNGAIENLCTLLGIEGSDLNGTISSEVDIVNLPELMSTALLTDDASVAMLAMASRMQVGSGIGGHPSVSGHASMFEDIVKAYVSGHTSEDETKAFLVSYLKEKYPALMDKLGYVTELGESDELSRIVMMLKLAQSQGNAALQGIDLDAIEAAIRANLKAYQNSHTLEQQAAAQAAAYDLMVDLQKLAAKVTAVDYEVKENSYYVSLGDSNVNGHMLEGFKPDYNGGFNQKIEGAAPVELAQKLYGEDWEAKFGQYALGSLRCEDMLYILGTDGINTDDYWDDEVSWRVAAAIKSINSDKTIQEIYIEAIEKADLISIALGGGNVTTFTGEQVDRIVANSDDDPTNDQELVEMNWKKIGYDDPTIDQLKAFLAEMVPLMDTLGLMNTYLPEDLRGQIKNPAAFASTLLESLLYGYASYNYYYPQVLARIREINPDAKLVIIGMFNPIDDWTMEMAGETINIGGVVRNVMEMANIQNLAYALQNDNTTFVDINEAETFLDAQIKAGTAKPTFTTYYTSILAGNGDNVHANENGHAYMFEQIYANLGGVNVDTEIDAIVKDFYDALNANYLTTQEKLAAIGKAYAALDEKGVLNEYPIVKVVEDLYVALSAKGLLTDDHSLAIVINVYEKLLDRKLDPAELRAIVDYVYFKVFAIKQVRGPELNLGIFSAGEKLDILETVYEVLEKNNYIDSSIPGVSDIVTLYNDIRDDQILDDEKIETLIGKVVKTYVETDIIGEEEIKDLATECVEEIFNDDSIPAENKVNLFNKVVETLNNVVGNNSAIIPDAPALPDLTIVNEVLAALEAEGLLTHDQASELIAKALTAILSDNIDPIALVDELYAIVYSEGFDAERTAKIVLVIVDTLYHDEEFIEFADAYYAIAVQYVLNAENKKLALTYIDYAIDAVIKATNAVNAYAVAPEYVKVKAALLEELAETLDTLNVARDIIASDKLLGIHSTVDAMLTLKDELVDHFATISALGLEIGLAADPHIQHALAMVQHYIDLADTTILNAYNWLVENVDQFVADYLALVETIGAQVDKFDPTIGQAVRDFMIDTPADALAIIYQFGKDAAYKLAVDAAEAAGDIYKEAMTLAGILAQYGKEIYNAIKNSGECQTILAKLDTLYGQIENLMAAASVAPAATAKKQIYDKIDQIKAEALALADDFWNAAIKAVSVADPYVGMVLEDAITAVTNSIGIIGDAADEYADWFLLNADAMCGMLLESLLENWTELFDIAWPIIVQKATDLYNKIKDFIVNYDYDALIQKIIDAAIKFAPELDAYLYDFFYNNPDKVEAFFVEYGDLILELYDKYGDIALAIIGFVLYQYGDDVVEYVVNNPDEFIAGVIAWAQKYGMRVIDIVDVYAKYFHLYEKAIAFAPELDAYLYDFLYNNPDKVVAFFTEYGDEIEYLYEKYGDYALVVIAYALYTYGPELVEYILDNPEEVFAALVEWTKKYGKRVADILQVYAEYLGLCQPVQEQIDNLKAQLGKLYDELADLYEQLKTAVGDEYNKILGYINQILDMIAKIEAQINVLMAKLQALIDALNQLNEALKQLLKDGIDAFGAIQQALNKVAYAIYDLVNVLSEDLAGQINNLIQNIKDYLNNAYDSAILADYIINKDSKYVAFGDNALAAQLFALALASKVAEKNVGYSYNFDISNAKDGAKITDLMAAIMTNPAVVADADLISIGYSYDQISEETIDIFFDLALRGEASTPATVDWNALLGSEIGKEVVKVLAQIEAELNANGLNKTLAEVAPAEYASFFNSNVTIAEAAMTALEFFAYYAVEYAVLMPQAVTMINQINPDALIMVNAISNPISGAALALPEFNLNVAFGDYLDYVVDIIYVESLALAAINDSVVFATATDVETTFTNMVINNENFLDIFATILDPEEIIPIDTTEVGSQTIAAKMIAALNITVQDSALLGDVNHDGKVDYVDAIFILEYDALLPVSIDLTVGDVDGNGSVDYNDAIWVLEYDAMLVDKFPAAK